MCISPAVRVHKSQQLVSIIFILQDVHQRIVGYVAMVVACRHRLRQTHDSAGVYQAKFEQLCILLKLRLRHI